MCVCGHIGVCMVVYMEESNIQTFLKHISTIMVFGVLLYVVRS